MYPNWIVVTDVPDSKAALATGLRGAPSSQRQEVKIKRASNTWIEPQEVLPHRVSGAPASRSAQSSRRDEPWGTGARLELVTRTAPPQRFGDWAKPDVGSMILRTVELPVKASARVNTHHAFTPRSAELQSLPAAPPLASFSAHKVPGRRSWRKNPSTANNYRRAQEVFRRVDSTSVVVWPGGRDICNQNGR